MKKRFLVFLVIGVMTFALMACGKNQAGAAGDADQTTQEQEVEDTSTPARALRADFKARVKEDESKTTEQLANDLMTNSVIPFSPMVQQVQPGYLNGFTEEINGFSDATMFGPMIGSIPFVGYIFEVEGDTEEFMLKLVDKSDLRWNVCTEADEKVCEAVGQKVFFVMSPAKFEE